MFLRIVEGCVDKLPPSACRVRTCSGPRAPPPCSYSGFQGVEAPRGGCCPEQGKRGGFCAGLSNNPSSENSTLSEQDEVPKPCPALHPESLNPRDRNSSVDQNMCLDLKTRGLRRTAGPEDSRTGQLPPGERKAKARPEALRAPSHHDSSKLKENLSLHRTSPSPGEHTHSPALSTLKAVNFTGVPLSKEIPLKAQLGGRKGEELWSTWWAPESPGRGQSWDQPLGGLLAPRDHPPPAEPAAPKASWWWRAGLRNSLGPLGGARPWGVAGGGGVGESLLPSGPGPKTKGGKGTPGRRSR